MIVDIFLYLLAFFLGLLSSLLSSISFVLPVQFSNAIGYFLSYFGYLRGWLDIDILFQAIGIYLIFLGSYYLVRILLWVYSHIPFIGKHVDFPSVRHTITDSVDQKGRHNVRWTDTFKT